MASYQRIALFVFFDAIERDLVSVLRKLPMHNNKLLNDPERQRASSRLKSREDATLDLTDDQDLVIGLDLGDKYDVLMRHRSMLDAATSDYYQSKKRNLERAIPIRNATMHGRPLTTEEYAIGFSLISEFLSVPRFWPNLRTTHDQYQSNPASFSGILSQAVDVEPTVETLNNLPLPDYDDTGVFPRRQIENELRKKILGRYPVVTLFGEGGNGKTALALQTLYGLIGSADENFDAVVWVSAKSTQLTSGEVKRIEGAISDSLGLFQEVADIMEPGDAEPIERVRKLLSENRILLAIDNLETIADSRIKEFASDVPGDSKILFTSRIPLGAGITVNVPGLAEGEALSFLNRVADAYDIVNLQKAPLGRKNRYTKLLGYKPLLLKWFALGVLSGLDPETILRNPDIAVRFCLESVVKMLSGETREIAIAIAVLPGTSSPAVLQRVTGLTAIQTESAIGELLRFGLVEQQASAEFERIYTVSAFAKT